MVAQASEDERMDGLFVKSGEFCRVWSVYCLGGSESVAPAVCESLVWLVEVGGG